MRTIVLALFAISATALIGCKSDSTALDPADVEAVEIQLHPEGKEAPDPIRTTDPEIIRAVVEALRPVADAPSHKCSSAGMLVISRKSGGKLQVYILPGHDEGFYEYGGKDMNGMHRVNREQFLAAMKKLGAKVPVLCGRSK